MASSEYFFRSLSVSVEAYRTNFKTMSDLARRMEKGMRAAIKADGDGRKNRAYVWRKDKMSSTETDGGRMIKVSECLT